MQVHRFFRITRNLLLAGALIGITGSASAETEEDWGHRALKLQANLDMDEPLAQTMWLGTHNSFANPVDDTMLDYNQPFSLKGQLNRGVREFVFDVHYWGTDVINESDFDVVVCHNNDSEACIFNKTGYRKLSHALDDIKQWINQDEANRNQVIMIKLEMTDKARHHHNKVQHKIENSIGNYVFQTDYVSSFGDNDPLTGCTTLPSQYLTKRAVLAKHKNIIIYNSHSCMSDTGFNKLSFYQVPLIDNLLTGMGNVNSIDALNNWTDLEKDKRMSRAKDAMTRDKELSDASTVKMKPSNVFDWMRAGLNLFELYGYDANDSAWRKGGERTVQAEDIVWGWRTGYPSTNTDHNSNCAIYEAGSRKFRDMPCGDYHYIACRTKTDHSWFVSSNLGTWSEANAICKSENSNAEFRVPTNLNELDSLTVANDYSSGRDLWVNYTDQVHEGEWIANRTPAQLAQHAWSETGIRGGWNGTQYDDKDKLVYDMYRFKRYITRINMSAGNRVDKVGFEYSNGDTTSYGGNGYDRHLTLVSGEHIVQAKVCTESYNGSWRVFYLKFTTDKGNILEGGKTTDYCQTFTADTGKEFFGMKGWYGNELDAIGFYQRVIN